jgi:cell division protein FtsZ
MLVNIIGGTDLTLPKVNEIMTAVSEQFGRESHIIMGAVIDEGMQNRVEVCVLGMSDMGGRAVSPRRPIPAARTKSPFPMEKGASTLTTAPAIAAGSSSAGALPTEAAAPTVTAGAKVAQEEFGFGEVESRGHFEKTDRNLFEGQDLDVPTYLRKGIKISI